jgi:hypothetical protein
MTATAKTMLEGALRTSSSILVSGEPLPVADLASVLHAKPLDLRNPAQVPDVAALRAAADKAGAMFVVLVGSEVPERVVQLVGDVAGSEDKRVVVLCATKTPPASLASRCAIHLDAAKALRAH